MELSDAGRYYCTVSNQAGSDHRGLDLRVFGKVLVLYSTLLLDLQGFNPFKTLLMKYFLSAIIDRKKNQTNKNRYLSCSVLVSPSISPGPFNVTVTAGVRAVLSCETTGIPSPKVSWKRNGSPLDTSRQFEVYR